jgi:hypothetical protein
METKLLKLLIDKGEINITDLFHLMPEIEGEFSIFMPAHEGINPNILWIGGVNEEFCKLFRKLLNYEKVIDWKYVDIIDYIIDGSPCYTLPIANKKSIKNKKYCWLPISIKLV